MRVSDVHPGDTIFYNFEPEDFLEQRGLAPDMRHVAVVTAQCNGIPEVAHLTELGLQLNLLSQKFIDYSGNTGCKVYRYQGDAIRLQRVAEQARCWVINHPDSKSHGKYGVTERDDISEDWTWIDPTGYSITMATKSFSKLAGIRASMGLSYYGSKARRQVHYLVEECGNKTPSWFINAEGGGHICSCFVIAAWQAALGEQSSACHMALDACATRPETLYEYVNRHSIWQSLGYIGLIPDDE
ncbi:hypothetical protein ACWJJH_02755 [Endozoicomonadaceae bacterium StTr2]